jgi:hypothetical protein
MVFGSAEAFTPEQLAELYDVNVLRTERVNRAALPPVVFGDTGEPKNKRCKHDDSSSKKQHHSIQIDRCARQHVRRNEAAHATNSADRECDSQRASRSARTKLSVSICRMIRPRLAPKAMRSAISFVRVAPRTKNKFATLAHAINNTNITAPNSTTIAGGSLPCIYLDKHIPCGVYQGNGICVRNHCGAEPSRDIEPPGLVTTFGWRDRASTSYAAADRVKAPTSAARGRFRGIQGGRTAPSLPAET